MSDPFDSKSDAEHPRRRMARVITREVGDELVAYDLTSEQVTAMDPVTAAVWGRLDGHTELAEIAGDAGLSLADVEAAVDRLDDAGLIVSGLARRRFLRVAAIGAGPARAPLGFQGRQSVLARTLRSSS